MTSYSFRALRQFRHYLTHIHTYIHTKPSRPVYLSVCLNALCPIEHNNPTEKTQKKHAEANWAQLLSRHATICNSFLSETVGRRNAYVRCWLGRYFEKFAVGGGVSSERLAKGGQVLHYRQCLSCLALPHPYYLLRAI